jgi:hypothetical protein
MPETELSRDEAGLERWDRNFTELEATRPGAVRDHLNGYELLVEVHMRTGG